MIHKLRKRHKRIWILIALLLPVLFFLAYFSVPKFSNQEFMFDDIPSPLPKIIKQIEAEEYKINYRQDNLQNLQLELIMKESVQMPTPILFLRYSDNYQASEPNIFLGNAGGKGIYRFKVQDTLANGIFFKSKLDAQKIVSFDFHK